MNDDLIGKVQGKLEELIVTKEAKRQFTALNSPELPPILSDSEFLDTEYTPDPWLFRGLVEVDQRVILSGYRKAGKTTFMSDAVRTYLDGGAFLGCFEATEEIGTECPVLYLNLEVPERKFQEYVAGIGLLSRDRLRVCNLGGKGFNILSDPHFDWLDAAVNEMGVCTLIVDPLRRCYEGDENDNGIAKEVVDRFDRLIDRNPCLRNVFIVAHTGHEQGNSFVEDPGLFARPRGASVWGDWADVLLSLTVDRQMNRYLAFTGRSGEMPATLLTLNGFGLRLELGVDSRNVRDNRIDTDILAYVSRVGVCNMRALKATIRGDDSAIITAVDRLTAEGLLTKERNPSDKRESIVKLAV